MIYAYGRYIKGGKTFATYELAVNFRNRRLRGEYEDIDDIGVGYFDEREYQIFDYMISPISE